MITTLAIKKDIHARQASVISPDYTLEMMYQDASHFAYPPLSNKIHLLWTSVYLWMEHTLPACQFSTHLSAILSSFSLLQKGIIIIGLQILYIFHIFVFIFSIYDILKLCTLETTLLKLHCLNCLQLIFLDVKIYFPLSI